jgi:hypothetical protein
MFSAFPHLVLHRCLAPKPGFSIDRSAWTGLLRGLADRRPDRVVWQDRQWQWAGLRFENGSFDTANYTDTYARDKWFFQAIAASPAMFRRDAGAGSLY